MFLGWLMLSRFLSQFALLVLQPGAKMPNHSIVIRRSCSLLFSACLPTFSRRIILHLHRLRVSIKGFGSPVV